MLLLSETEVSVHKKVMGRPRAILRPKQYPQKLEQDVHGMKNGEPVKVRTIIEVPQNYGAFVLLVDCSNIQPEKGYSCADYPNRPNACKTYQVGSKACLDARAAFGLDGHPQTISPEIRTEPIKLRVPKY